MGIIFNLFNMHNSPYLCVHGDDRMIRYPGADDLTGEPGDAWDQREGWFGLFEDLNFLMYLCFGH